jgi:hypothetical protein
MGAARCALIAIEPKKPAPAIPGDPNGIGGLLAEFPMVFAAGCEAGSRAPQKQNLLNQDLARLDTTIPSELRNHIREKVHT